MTIVLRPGTAADAPACGKICYDAFRAIATAHNFPPDFPSPEVASGLLSGLLTHPRFYSVVAENEGRIVGSNFLDERSCISGVGPITVDPTGQNRGVGGLLMQDVLGRAAQRQAAGVRLRGYACCSPDTTTARSLFTRSSVSIPGSPYRSFKASRFCGSSRATRFVLRRRPMWLLATQSACGFMGSIVGVNCATQSIRRQRRSSSIMGASPATRPGSPSSATASRRPTGI